MADVIIHSDNFTDENGELHYFNTGRDNVSGLSYPTHYVRNKDNYFFTRLLQIKLSMDTALVYPIHECFLLTTFTDDNTRGTTNIVTVDAIVKDSIISYYDIKVTCTPMNHEDDVIGGKIHDIKAALKGELNSDGHISMSLGIWLYSKDIIDIVITNLSSLSFNNIPNNIYHNFLQCDYEAHYLNNEDVVYEVNMFNFEESIGTKIASGLNVNKELIDAINKPETPEEDINHNKFLSVIYDDMYTITDINTDEIIKPTAFQYVQVDNSFATINNDYVQVNEAGSYLIALKVNMDIHDGDATKMMMSFFLNDDRIEETTSSMYLDPSNKTYPLGFLAGQVHIQLKPSDKLYLKARWTNKNNVNIENHCTLQITKLV